MERKPEGYWQNISNVRDEITRWRATNGGKFPSHKALVRTKHFALASAIVRVYGGYNAIRRALGEPIVQRSAGYWDDFENLRAALIEWREAHPGPFPHARQLEESGCCDLVGAIAKHGGFAAVRTKMGAGVTKLPNGHWRELDQVRLAIQSWMKKHNGRFPTKQELESSGYAALAVGINKYHGGFAAVRTKLGYELTQMPRGYWDDFENVRQAIDDWRLKHSGAFPTAHDLEGSGRADLIGAIAKHGGFLRVRERMGVELNKKPKGYWETFENVAKAIELFIEAHGYFPSTTDLAHSGLSAVARGIYLHHESLGAVRSRMGYSFVADEDLKRHADVLTEVIPQLSTPPSTLWSAMKSRWTRRDLDAAMAEYNQTPSLERFRSLLKQD